MSLVVIALMPSLTKVPAQPLCESEDREEKVKCSTDSLITDTAIRLMNQLKKLVGAFPQLSQTRHFFPQAPTPNESVKWLSRFILETSKVF